VPGHGQAADARHRAIFGDEFSGPAGPAPNPANVPRRNEADPDADQEMPDATRVLRSSRFTRASASTETIG